MNISTSPASKSSVTVGVLGWVELLCPCAEVWSVLDDVECFLSILLNLFMDSFLGSEQSSKVYVLTDAVNDYVLFFRKLGDGLFLNCCRTVAEDYPEIEFNDMIIDNASMQVRLIVNSHLDIVSTWKSAVFYTCFLWRKNWFLWRKNWFEWWIGVNHYQWASVYACLYESDNLDKTVVR